jgi:hypothetical protein
VCTINALHENDDLVELKFIEQIYQYLDLLILFNLGIVLLQTVKSHFALIIDEDLELITHELTAYVLHIIFHGGREHHNLLLGRGGLENGLNVTSHIYY